MMETPEYDLIRIENRNDFVQAINVRAEAGWLVDQMEITRTSNGVSIHYALMIRWRDS